MTPAKADPTFITNAGGTQTALVNTDDSYKYLGRLVLEFDADGNIIPESYSRGVGAYAADAERCRFGRRRSGGSWHSGDCRYHRRTTILSESNVLGNAGVF